jgi:hypothetical protein
MSNIKEITKRLYAYSMFDGCLTKVKKTSTNNAYLIVNMLEENVDYIEAVELTLDEADIGFKRSYPPIYKKDGYKRKQQIRLQSAAHPKLTKIYNRIYLEGHKVIDPHMLTLMDGEMLGIAFMTDGSRHVDKRWANAKPNYRLHLNNLSYGDLMLFKKCVKDAFGLEVNLRKKGQKYDVGVPTAYANLFEEVITPHILPSFQYKLGR